jgi:hypothetical protein
MQLAISALKRYKKSYGEGEKPEYLAKRFTGLSVGRAARIIAVINNATAAQLANIAKENITINSVYENLKRVSTNPF